MNTTSSKKGSGFDTLLILGILALGAFFAVTAYFHESPQQFVEQCTGLGHQHLQVIVTKP
jgi:hypothetical protein